jgi:hypothetical protein
MLGELAVIQPLYRAARARAHSFSVRAHSFRVMAALSGAVPTMMSLHY